MALTYRFYRAPTVGDGMTPQTAKQSKLKNYITQQINDPDGPTFWDWDHPARNVRYSFVRCEDTLHPTIEADAEITPLSPVFADLNEANAWLDQTITSLTQAARNLLESDGFSVAWADGLSTRRQLFRYMVRIYSIAQDMVRLNRFNSLELLRRGLDITRSQLTAAQRNAIQAWCDDKGISYAWTTGSTTMREWIHFLINNNDGWAVMRLGPLTF